ncbi:MAG: hypothetical protein KIS77_06750 [Saprospiraceae bacterium]|nr:hypothetical protein [Saprospiraceae bacterium]
MRIIGYIEHPHLKITVFRMDERVSVKFENALYELTFKLGQDERLATLENVRQWVDAAFVEQVLDHFQQMHKTRMGAMARAFPLEEHDVFEEII